MRLHYLQHVSFEGLARIRDWADAGRHTVSVTRLYAAERLPALEDLDFLVVLGGPMGANDDQRFPWMRAEKAFLEAAIAAQKKVLGICLGAQLIAAVSGANVYRNREKEIGWFPIELDPPNVRDHALNVLPQRATVFHWHGDTFDLPRGARHLARSRACENQAFALGAHATGLQFHLELGAPQIDALVQNAAADLSDGDFVQDPPKMAELTAAYAPPANAAPFRFLDAFTKAAVR